MFKTALVLAALSWALLLASAGFFIIQGTQLSQRNEDAIAAIEREARDRRDQSCKISERTHLSDVQQLRRTYRYLLDPSKFGDRKGSDLYNVVLAQLSRTEKEARTDRAPKFCDEPGIGLPEPDPVVPKRPSSL